MNMIHKQKHPILNNCYIFNPLSAKFVMLTNYIFLNNTFLCKSVQSVFFFTSASD